MSNTGTLSVVATPIGNLEDITLRALRVLKEADYILCEDTRVTGKLCAHYDMTTERRRYDAHASARVHKEILADLAAGRHIALVSDAGTPGVSDPGVMLISMARAAGARIEAIPGPSAVTAAVSIAGLIGNQFSFLGFVPQKKGRQTFFAELADYGHPVVLFESMHGNMKTLEALDDLYPEAELRIGRELTKQFEEMITGAPVDILTILMNDQNKQKGEFVLIFSMPKQ